jgi:glycosyltransferase involved in cell wall biosynthesis
MQQSHLEEAVQDAIGNVGSGWPSTAGAATTGPGTAIDRPAALRGRPQVEGKFLRVGGERFWVKGVTYGTFHQNDEGEPYPPFDRLRGDFARMAEAGINTVRLYTPPSDRIADAAAESGLHLIPDLCWGPRKCELHEPDDLRAIFDWTRNHARRLAGHPSILMFSIGNEIPPLLVRWYGRQRIEAFLRGLNDIVKAEAPESLVTYACHPPTEHLHLPFLDVVSFNVYLEREEEFRRYLGRLHALAGDRPLLLTELGLDSGTHGEPAQAQVIDWQLRAAFEKGLCGATVYGWTDEWSIFDESVEGWSFGLTDGSRRPKLALEAASRIYRSSRYDLRERPWPRVSVVVASYNGAATLDQCLSSLEHSNYPDYEMIVIDDGSRDATAEIAGRYPVRCIRVENGGLSRARNLGVTASEGEIVAFLDSDAYADPDWLFFLVTALEDQEAVAVGGPNLSPPDDGFVAQCVDRSPGNPTHVLIGDELAEHVPGCNMAFRKASLEAIGGFDAVHRAAGDDVDVCWKLLARGDRIAFSPGGIVWHHRRGTVRAFLRQQRGYGYAEGHLKRTYPGRFNVFGHLVWPGRVYDGVHNGLRLTGLPALVPSRVYHGRFGGAPFQSLYQPFPTWWFQAFMTAEWQLTVLCMLATALLVGPGAPWSGLALLLVFGLMATLTVGAAATAGWFACREKMWRGGDALRGGALVAFLHLAQPLARAYGQLLGWWKTRGTPSRWTAEQTVWGNLDLRERWLDRLSEHIRRCGWDCRQAGEWDSHDLEVPGPGPRRAYLSSVAEERLEKGWFQIRFRITTRMKPQALVLTAALLATLPLFALLPEWSPLAIPTGVMLRALMRSEAGMTEAMSQLAMECAEAMGMPDAKGYRC